MKQVITAKDIEEMRAQGASPEAIPETAIITPAAEDLIGEWKRQATSAAATSAGASHAMNQSSSANGAAAAQDWSPVPPAGPDPVPPNGPPWVAPDQPLEKFFTTPENENRKGQICDVGRRLWAREYVDGNGGNISIRVGENLALCTPTLVSKGFMRPSHICMVDLDGNQKAGQRPRTSEILMHLEIMKAQEKAVACVHCHPPYATAFAAAGVNPPNNILPEFEVFIGEVPIAGYDTPGTIEMAKKVAQLTEHHNTILMANHGVVAWSHLSVEDAYFKMEILEAYCRTIMVTTQLGKVPNRFSPEQMQDLLNIKQTLGVPDPRFERDAQDLSTDDQQWRPGVFCMNPSVGAAQDGSGAPYGGSEGLDPEAEKAVQEVTDIIMERVSS